MTHKTIEERLAQLEARRSELKSRLSKQERANETRRKVLIGTLVLQRLESTDDPEFSRRLHEWLRRELPNFLQRDIDRSLFRTLIETAPAMKAASPPREEGT